MDLNEIDRQRKHLQAQLDALNKQREHLLAEEKQAEAREWADAYQRCVKLIPTQLLNTENSILFFRCPVCHEDYPRAPLIESHSELGTWFHGWELKFPHCNHSVCRACAPRMLKYNEVDLTRNSVCIQCPLCRGQFYTMTLPAHDELKDNYIELSEHDSMHITTPAPPEDMIDEDDDEDDG